MCLLKESLALHLEPLRRSCSRGFLWWLHRLNSLWPGRFSIVSSSSINLCKLTNLTFLPSLLFVGPVPDVLLHTAADGGYRLVRQTETTSLTSRAVLSIPDCFSWKDFSA
mgnify:CR=1 FL=1